MGTEVFHDQIKRESVSNDAARTFDMLLILMIEKVNQIKFSQQSNATKSEDSWLTHLQPALSKPKLFHNIIFFEKNTVTDEQCELL